MCLHFLIVDDDREAAEALAMMVSDSGYRATVATDGAAAIAAVEQARPDGVITDLQMPGMSGNELLRRLHAIDRGLPVILVTGYSAIGTAVRAMANGAVDYLPKPVEWPAIEERLLEALRRRALAVRADPVARSLRERMGLGLGAMIGASTKMRELFDWARRVAPSQATVLLTGESGTGKGELAQAIHNMSERRDGPFVAVSCAALTDGLVESALFGHERGAFTGAVDRTLGRFERAHGGTLFIDEVGEIPARTQVRLLRVLQERAFERVGGGSTIEVDVRLVAATNANLEQRVAEGDFRQDLFYRLNVVRMGCPPLREREGDILLLAQSFLEDYAVSNHRAAREFDRAAQLKLLAWHWPGNVRELRNAVECGVVMSQSRFVGASDLPALGKAEPQIPGDTMKQIELSAVRATYLATGGCTKSTAAILGISERTVQNRLRTLGMSRPRGRPSGSGSPPSKR